MQPDVSQDQIAQKYGISQSLVSKWLKDKDSIIAAATYKHRKLYAKQRKSTKYLELYRLLFDQLKAVHDKGRKVNFNWLWISGDKVIIRKHERTTFFKKYNVQMCARQRNLVSQKKHLEQIP